MAATVELCESNENSGEEITHNITNMNFGSVDDPNLTPASYPVTIPGESYFKLIRLHVTNLGGSNSVGNIRWWKSNGDYVTDEGIQASLHETQDPNYDAVKVTEYATPNATEYTGYAIPTSEPSGANLGIGGSLTGTLTDVGYSDYLKIQRQSGASTPPGDANQLTNSCKYDEQ